MVALTGGGGSSRIAILLLLLLAVVVGASLVVAEENSAVTKVCQSTDYRERCVEKLGSAAGNTTDPLEIIKIGFAAASKEIRAAIKNSSAIKEAAKDPRTKKALDVCKRLLEFSIDELHSSFERMGNVDITNLNRFIANLNVWLSGAVTYQESCLDAFENTTGNAGDKMKKLLNTSMELTSNGLAMVSQVQSLVTTLDLSWLGGRRLLWEEQGSTGDYNSWVGTSSTKKRIIRAQEVTPAKADVVVAQDGSGKYKTIREALKQVPKPNPKSFVIHIKAGVYKERIVVDANTTNVVFIGDGPTKTVITGNASFVDGLPAIATATVTVQGMNFIAKDISFENSAGPQKRQAVALLVQSDQSIFYNCHINGYQNTLYALTHRQFYRNCTIRGTLDIIIGDGIALFQSCDIIIRKPLESQQCVVTASGRTDHRSAAAIVLQNCTIKGEPEYLPVMDINKAYLGRPWKNYSRAIVMQSNIEKVIQPKGWVPLFGKINLDTCYFAEYQNRGPGADQKQRVTWKGIKKLSKDQIMEYTPSTFFKVDNWIVASKVPYDPDLIQL